MQSAERYIIQKLRAKTSGIHVKLRLLKQPGEREDKECCQFQPLYDMRLDPCDSTPYSDTC